MQYGMGKEEHDREGRLITLEFPAFYFATVYVPNSQRELTRLDYRMQWEDDFLAYLQTLDQNKPVIFCGDLNVAHREIDLKNPKTNHKNAGFTDEERGKMTALLGSGFTDTFRYFYPEPPAYTAGGAICSTPERRTPVGVLTTLSPLTGCNLNCGTPRSTRIFLAATTAPLSWTSTCNPQQKDHLRKQNLRRWSYFCIIIYALFLHFDGIDHHIIDRFIPGSAGYGSDGVQHIGTVDQLAEHRVVEVQPGGATTCLYCSTTSVG